MQKNVKRAPTVKKTLSKKVKTVRKAVKKQVNVGSKRLKKLRKTTAKRVKKLRKQLAKGFKRQRKRTAKSVKRFKAQRRKAFNKRFSKSNISLENARLIGFTDEPSQTSESTAFVKTFPESRGASKPGEPPKKRTGNGRDAIKAQLIKNKKDKAGVQTRVYVDKRKAAYMALWEYRPDGKARPFLKPALEDNKKMFGARIGKKLKQKLKGKL